MKIPGRAGDSRAWQGDGATASSRELRRRSRARHPHFQIARGRGFDPDSTLTAMDIEGVDVAVMYGTRGRQILMHDDLAPDYAAALARAYNNWAHDYCQSEPTRLKFAAQVAMHSIPAAIEGARRCVRELGAVAIIGTPNPANGQHLHDEACDPLWSALEELDVPIGFHPTGNTSLKDDAGRRYVGHANFHPIAHAIRRSRRSTSSTRWAPTTSWPRPTIRTPTARSPRRWSSSSGCRSARMSGARSSGTIARASTTSTRRRPP
jgi:predicted TIM-barrel fold metal-dependent hydrolase